MIEYKDPVVSSHHFTVMVDPTPLLDGSGNCYQRHVVDLFIDDVFAGVRIAHSMSEALYIGEQWIRIRQVEEEHPPKTIDGYNPEFLGAKPARSGEDY